MARGEVVYVVRPTGKGRFGDPNPGTPVRYEIPDTLIAPGPSVENNNGVNQVDTDMTIYPPHSITTLVPDGPRPSDQVEVRGDLFEIVGDPQDWGVKQRMVIKLNRVKG